MQNNTHKQLYGKRSGIQTHDPRYSFQIQAVYFILNIIPIFLLIPLFISSLSLPSHPLSYYSSSFLLTLPILFLHPLSAFWSPLSVPFWARKVYVASHLHFINFAAYLDKGEHNIIAVDWSRLSPGPCYPSAVYNTRFAGKCIAQLVEALRLDGASNIHLVGFSLGAHVAGFAANALRPYKLPRITGMFALCLGAHVTGFAAKSLPY